jgi:sulfofructose kinase
MTRGIVVGVGHCTVDYLGLVPRYPETSESAEIAEFSQQGGGSAATALATLAIFGAPTRFVGKVSDDHFGRFIRKGLDGLGVDTSTLVVEPDRVSPFTFSVVEMGVGRPTNFWSRGSVSPLRGDEIDLGKVLADAALVMLDGYALDAQVAVATAARERAVPVILDTETADERTAELIPYTNTLVSSERIATEITQAGELEASLHKLQERGPRRCIITLGLEGAIGLDDNGRVHEEPAFVVEEKDITGAGDIYLGALTYATLQEWPLPEAMRFASVAAGLSCQRLGARAGIPRLAEVVANAGLGTG